MNKNGYLLDTHTLVWLLQDRDKLNKNIREDIEYFQYSYYASVASLHEIILLIKEGKLDSKRCISDFINYVQEKQIQFLDIKPNHMKVLEKLSIPVVGKDLHKDPFDRVIIATALNKDLILLTADENVKKYNVKWIW